MVIPFGLGKRRCLGESLAKTSLYIFFATIVQRFDIVRPTKELISEESTIGLIRMPKPYKVIFRPRS